MSMVRFYLRENTKEQSIAMFFRLPGSWPPFIQHNYQLGERLHPCTICSLVYKIQSVKLLDNKLSINLIFACGIYFSFNCISSDVVN